jgi:signal transduction histidine kinase
MRGFKLDAGVPAQDADARDAPNALTDAYAEVVGVGVLSLRSDGTLIACNRQFAQLCDLPPSELPPRGLACNSLVTLVERLVKHADERTRAIGKLLASESGSSGEIVSSDGRTLEWRRVGLADDRGQVWAFADVSETRQMAAALVDAAGWLRMLEAHTDGVLVELDADARIVGLWGPSREFFDAPDTVLQGKTLIEAIAGAEGAALDARVRSALSSATRQDYECCVERNGTSRVLSTSAVLMPSDTAPPHVTLMIRDVTERAHTQAKLLQVERLASIGLLAAGVAHEINNPLTYVLLNLERVRSNMARLGGGAETAALLSEIRTAIEMSVEGASRVQTIVRELTRFSRPDEHRLLPVDVHRSLDFAIAMAEPELQSRAKLTREYEPLPLVRASEARLSQIFLNLIINAAHALPDDGGRSEIRVVTRTGPGGQAVIEIHDTGRGMSSAALKRLFEPFYTTKPPGLGTGLGLTICHDIVASLGGQIEVESNEGRGSVFRVVLPPIIVPG